MQSSISSPQSLTNNVNNDISFPDYYGLNFFISWAVCPSLMVLSERYFRSKSPYWLITTITGSTLLTYLSMKEIYDRAERQGPQLNALAFNSMIVNIAINVLIGILLIVWRGTNSGSKKPSFYVKWFHIIYGYASVIAISLMAVFGYIELHPNIRMIWIAFLLIAVCLVALFEFAWWSHWFAEKSYITSAVPFTHALLREEVIKNKKPYLSFENKIIDMGTWAMHHPGGRFSIQYNFGKDVGRYLLGVYALNRNYRAYKHSQYAINIVKDKIVGYLKENVDLKFQLFVFKPGVLQNDNKGWKIVKQDQLTSLIKRIGFRKEGIQRKIFLNDTSVWGKHIKIRAPITDYGQNEIRFYTFSQALSEESLEIHRHLAQSFHKREDVTHKLDPWKLSDCSFMIYPKLYNYPKAFSRFLHQTKKIEAQQNCFQIDGPMGLGLDLNKKSQGHHVALTAGTGIVPFMDLVFYLMRRNLYQYGNKISKDFQGIKHESEFDLLGNQFSFELWGNFRNQDEVIAYDTLKAAEVISNQNGSKNFSMNLRIANIDKKPRWNTQYMKKNLNFKKIQRIYIRGPEDFNFQMEENLISLGFPRNEIIHL